VFSLDVCCCKDFFSKVLAKLYQYVVFFPPTHISLLVFVRIRWTLLGLALKWDWIWFATLHQLPGALVVHITFVFCSNLLHNYIHFLYLMLIVLFEMAI